MAEPGGPLPPPYAAHAVSLGLFVKAAYSMYDNAQPPGNPLPSPPSPFLPGYDFFAWVQMKDFFINEENYSFYGLLAQNRLNPNRYVLAIRGTRSDAEWWDDFRSMEQTTLTGFPGYVGYGFDQVYQTMRVIHHPQGVAAASSAESLESVGTFAQQVAAAVRLHAAGGAPLSELNALPRSAPPTIEVVGHSLGSALATLYVAENSVLPLNQRAKTPLICTLASPRVGDPVFAAAFNGLPIVSWRVVNLMDLVPRVPFEIPGVEYWQPVDTEYDYDSGWSGTWPSPGCWHSIETYLHLLDPSQPLLQECMPLTAQVPPPRLAAATASPRPADKGITIAAPAQQGTTINITIKIG
jgi:hypothetical protein